MKLWESNWMEIERYLERDDRAVLPLGSTEQHSYLSLCTDTIIANRIAADAAEPLGVPVFPPLHYGVTPYFKAYPGSVTLRLETYIALLRDILDSLSNSGFRRILVVNGHATNRGAHAFVLEWMSEHTETQVKWHEWLSATIWQQAKGIAPNPGHANWFENFPWTRLAGVAVPQEKREIAEFSHMMLLAPDDLREYLDDGSMGGEYQMPDEVMADLWQTTVEETRTVLEGPWR